MMMVMMILKYASHLSLNWHINNKKTTKLASFILEGQKYSTHMHTKWSINEWATLNVNGLRELRLCIAERTHIFCKSQNSTCLLNSIWSEILKIFTLDVNLIWNSKTPPPLDNAYNLTNFNLSLLNNLASNC